MAAPTSATPRYYSDEELKVLAQGGLSEEEVAQLSDDDIRRIGAMRSQDLLAGKPTIAEYEKQKILEATPRVTKPTRTIPGPPIDEAGPKDLTSFLASVGDALHGRRGDTGEPGALSAENVENFKTPRWEQLVMRAQNQPETFRSAESVGEKLRAAQDKLLGAGTKAYLGEGYTPSPQETEVVAKIATGALQEGVTSISEFVSHPWKQAAERPLEFGLNLLQAAMEITPAIRAARGLAAEAKVVGPNVAPRVGWGLNEPPISAEDLAKAVRAVPRETAAAEKVFGEKSAGFMERRSWPEQRQMVADKVAEWKAEGQTFDEVHERAASMKASGEITGAQESAFYREAQKSFGVAAGVDEETVATLRAAEAQSEARSAIVSATPTEVRAVHEVLETKLDDIAELKELNREIGGDPETMTKLRAMEAQIAGTQETIAETRAASSSTNRFEAGDVVKHKNGSTYVVDSVEILPGGKSKITVRDENDAAHVFHPAWLEPTGETHVPPSVKVPKTQAEWDEFHGSIPSTQPSPEELANMATNKAVPGAEFVPPQKAAPPKGTKVTTPDGYEYEYIGESPPHRGKPGERYWKANKPMPVTGDEGRVTESMIRKNGLAVPGEEAAPIAKSEISASTDAATAKTKLTDVLSVAPVGGILLAGIAQDDKADPTPKEGSPLALKSALWAVPAGIFAYGAARYFKALPFKKAMGEFAAFTRVSKAQPADLERFFETVVSPLFPDRPANGLQNVTPLLGTAAGAGIGALVGSQVWQDEVNPVGGAAGFVLGAALGAYGGRNLSRQFRTNLTYRELYKSYLTEAAGMSESAVNAKYMTRMALEGRVREIKDVATKLDSFDDATNGVIQSWMSGNTNIAQVPEKAREAAWAARKLFDDLSMDLLKSGLVKDKVLQQTIKSNIGTYVPRLMLRYEIDEPREVVEGWLRSQGKGWGYVSSKNYLKAKKDIPPMVLKALGEITDNPGYLLAKRGVITAADIEQARYHRFLLSSPENALPAKLVRQQRRIAKFQHKMRVGEEGVATTPNLTRAAKGTLMDEPTTVRFYKAETGMDAAEWQGRTYWKMPDNPRYGLVKNQYIEQSVANDIISTHETTGGLQALFDAPLSMFKYFKAVMNPASQFRNILSNTIFADLEAGIAPWRMDKWTKGMVDLNSKGKWYKQAARDGAFGGDFPTSEIGDLLLPRLEKSTSVMDFMGKTIPHYAEKPAEWFTKWHQGSEAWARMTVYRHAVESLGMDGSAAAKFARRTIPDYQDVPRWLKVVRQSPFGAPFISFSYKALPRSLEAAVAFGDPKKMMRFWKYPLAMAALNEYSAQEHGLLGKDEADKTDLFGTLRRTAIRTLTAGTYTPDSYDTFRKYLPNHVGGMQIGIPWRDQYDRQQYLDGTFFLPWGDAGEMGKGDFAKGIGASWFPRQLEPSNPWFQLGVAGMTGKDSFTGRDIMPAGAVGMEATMAWAQFLMRAWGPSLLNPAGYSAEALSRSFSGKMDEDPNVKSKMTAVASELARSRPVDPRTSYRFKWYEVKKELDSNMSELRRLIPQLMKQEDLTPEQVKQILKTNPSKAASRALRRRLEIVKRFEKQFPADELPPTPEKLVEAIRNQYKH